MSVIICDGGISRKYQLLDNWEEAKRRIGRSFVYKRAAGSPLFYARHWRLNTGAGSMPKDFLTLREACAHFPSRPHKNTVTRWATRGVYGVRLKTCRYGGKRLTRKIWIEEFNAKLLESSPSFQMDSEDSATVAESKLDAMGIS